MTHWHKDSFTLDLTTLLDLFTKYDVPVDPSTIYTLANTFKYADKYFVEIKDIVFDINSKISGTIPSEIKKMAIYLDHSCDYDLNKNLDRQDPIKTSSYIFNIKVIGYGENGEFKNFWHLDKDEKGNEDHKVTHPSYHFHFGGEELNGCDTGEIMFMGAPRLAHPPMDLFLGIHFIINNFYNSKQYSFVKSLMLDEEYRDIIIRAQKRLWEPYFNAYNPTAVHDNHTFENVFPLFLKN